MKPIEPPFDAATPRPSTGRGWLLPVALAGLGAVGWACRDAASGSNDGGAGDETADSGGDAVTRADVLRSVATQVIAPTTAAFAQDAAALQLAVATLADTTDEGGDVDAARVAAREAYHAAMLRWQRLEVMQVGPAGPSQSAAGGLDLRDAIYSWPTADTCAVDRGLVEKSYAAPDFFVTELVWSYGLDALEYLLFVDAASHSCPAQVQLDGPWTALAADELARRRAAYARVVADGIAAKADELATAWASDGGDFTALLAAPGEGDSPFANEAEALDEVFAAMFYVELETKDAKLGTPIGARDGCAAPPCIELLELPHAGTGAAAIRANLEALRELIQGGPDPATADGYDDLLIQLAVPEIAEDLDAAITAAIAAADTYDGSLQAALAADPDAVDPLFAAVKGVTDILKGRFVMALMLTVPIEGPGDSD